MSEIKQVDPTSFSPIAWEYEPSLRWLPGSRVTIEQCRQPGGGIKFAVRQSGCCLGRHGYWESEPSPSNRCETFLARCRFDTWQEAEAACRGYFEK